MNKPGLVKRTICPVCDAVDGLESIYRIPYNSGILKEHIIDFYRSQGGMVDYSILQDEEYHLIYCKNCHLVFQQSIPDESFMFELYERYIDARKKEEELELPDKYDRSYIFNIKSEINYFLKLRNFNGNEFNFLDYGMGWGFLCIQAKEAGMNVFGTELSPTRIRYGEALGIKMISIREIPDEFFDIINLSDVLEHLAMPMDMLKQLCEKLKPGGIIRISVPGNPYFLKWLKRCKRVVFGDWRFNCVAPLEHINCFHYETLRYIGNELNLTMVDTMDYLLPVNSIPGTINKIKYLIKKRILKQTFLEKSTNLVFCKQ